MKKHLLYKQQLIVIIVHITNGCSQLQAYVFKEQSL